MFDLNKHVFERRAENGTTEGLGELVIQKPGYFDASLKLGVEENGQSNRLSRRERDEDASPSFRLLTLPFAVKRQVDSLADGDFIQSQWALGRNVTIHGWVYSFVPSRPTRLLLPRR